MRERERELGPVWAVSKRRLKENEKKKLKMFGLSSYKHERGAVVTVKSVI